jgi:hypothetical protein
MFGAAIKITVKVGSNYLREPTVWNGVLDCRQEFSNGFDPTPPWMFSLQDLAIQAGRVRQFGVIMVSEQIFEGPGGGRMRIDVRMGIENRDLLNLSQEPSLNRTQS